MRLGWHSLSRAPVIGSFAGHRFIWKYNASQMQIVSCIASGTRK